MGEGTAIEWADHTFNPWSGCTKVSPGCANCYAEKLSARGMTNGKGERTLGEWGPGAPRKRTSAANWRKPLTWNRKAAKAQLLFEEGTYEGTRPPRPRVFCASLADWLDPEVSADWLADLLGLVAKTPHLDWLLLTKRPELWRDRVEAAFDELERRALNGFSNTEGWHLADKWVRGTAPTNVWVGTSVEDQQRVQRVLDLLAIPARVRFLSCEPLLGDIDVGEFLSPAVLADGPFYRASMEDVDSWAVSPEACIDWVIAGGESGPCARPMHPDWARSLRDQCQAAGAPFFFKQHGAWAPVRPPAAGGEGECWLWPDGHRSKKTVRGATPSSLTRPQLMRRVGKKKAGRELDGRTWDEVPA